MSLIERSAYLDICPKCGEHLDIVLADGRRVPNLGSKFRVLAMLDLMLVMMDIDGREYAVLIQQLAESKLPTSVDAPVSCEEREPARAEAPASELRPALMRSIFPTRHNPLIQ